MLELALVLPVIVGVFGLGFFVAHVYEVKSDLKRTAQRTAEYAAERCDPLGSYNPSSGCAVPPGQDASLCGSLTNTVGGVTNYPGNGCYRTDLELAQFATTRFFTGSRTGCFALTGTITGGASPRDCNTLAMTTTVGGSAYDGSTTTTCKADPDKLCKNFDPKGSGPRPNQRITITLRYRFNTPFATLMSALGFDKLAVSLSGHGEATVE